MRFGLKSADSVRWYGGLPAPEKEEMNTAVLTRVEELEAIRSEWDALAHLDARDGFFRTSGWYLSWLRCVRPDAQPFVITARSEDDRLVGLAPLCLYSYQDLGFRLDTVGFAGAEIVSGDFLDVLAEPTERARVLNATFDALQENRSRWGLLQLGEVLISGELHSIAKTRAGEMGLALREEQENICPFILLPSSFDEYLKGLNKSVRYNIRRRTKMILEEKNGSIEVCQGPADVSKGVDALVQLHHARWRSRNDPGTLGRPGFVNFIRDVCANPPGGSSYRLYVLRHAGQPAGAFLVFYFGESALYYQAGWDPNSPIERYSPGMVLMARSIQDAIDAGKHYYEFLRGDEAYKFRWTKSTRRTITLLAARSTVARTYLRTAQAKDLVKRLLGKGPAQSDPVPVAIEEPAEQQQK